MQHLKFGTELVPETSQNLHILMLSARENFSEFCRRETVKTSISYSWLQIVRQQ